MVKQNVKKRIRDIMSSEIDDESDSEHVCAKWRINWMIAMKYIMMKILLVRMKDLVKVLV